MLPQRNAGAPHPEPRRTGPHRTRLTSPSDDSLAQSTESAGAARPSTHSGTPRTDRSTAIASPTAHRCKSLAALALAAALALSGCSNSSDAAPDATSAAADNAALVKPADALEEIASTGTTVIDVRTPAEYADGHLTGARNIDLSSDTFDDLVSELDRDATYVVYCRTGARSAEAAARMADLGFTDLLDAGALSDLVAAGGTTETT